MTSPVLPQTAIIDKIVDHYSFQASDIQALKSQIESQLIVVYRMTIQKQLVLYGCQKTVTGPDSTSLAWIQAKAQEDTDSIIRTYERELRTQVRKTYEANKRSNRYAYIRALDAWTTRRNAYKVDSISLNTMTAARAYAQDRFIRENKIGGRYAPVGPPPVCIKCVRIFAKGPLTWEECQKAQNFLPAHGGCPHTRSALIPKKIPCNELTWTG